MNTLDANELEFMVWLNCEQPTLTVGPKVKRRLLAFKLGRSSVVVRFF